MLAEQLVVGSKIRSISSVTSHHVASLDDNRVVINQAAMLTMVIAAKHAVEWAGKESIRFTIQLKSEFKQRLRAGFAHTDVFKFRNEFDTKMSSIFDGIGKRLLGGDADLFSSEVLKSHLTLHNSLTRVDMLNCDFLAHLTAHLAARFAYKLVEDRTFIGETPRPKPKSLAEAQVRSLAESIKQAEFTYAVMLAYELPIFWLKHVTEEKNPKPSCIAMLIAKLVAFDAELFSCNLEGEARDLLLKLKNNPYVDWSNVLVPLFHKTSKKKIREEMDQNIVSVVRQFGEQYTGKEVGEGGEQWFYEGDSYAVADTTRVIDIMREFTANFYEPLGGFSFGFNFLFGLDSFSDWGRGSVSDSNHTTRFTH